MYLDKIHANCMKDNARLDIRDSGGNDDTIDFAEVLRICRLQTFR